MVQAIKINLQSFPLLLIMIFITFLQLAPSLPLVDSIQQLARQHCNAFPLDDLLRLAKGSLSEKYGPQFFEFDEYVVQHLGVDREYIRKDFQVQLSFESISERSQKQEDLEQIQPDWVVPLYVQGLKQCGLDWTEQDVFAVWRLVRWLVNHDYFYEWIRGKIRSLTGFQSLKYNAISNYQFNKGERFKIEKVIGLHQLHQLQAKYFREHVSYLLDFIRSTRALLMNGNFTKNGKPLLYFAMETYNVDVLPFGVYQFNLQIQKKRLKFLGVTVPGVPLLLMIRAQKMAWCFGGFNVDRSNIEQKETYKGRYFNEEVQKWVKIKNRTVKIKVLGQQQPRQVKFLQSQYGHFVHSVVHPPKTAEPVLIFRQNQHRVRRLFSDLFELLLDGRFPRERIDFPFASLLMTVGSDIGIIFCQPKKPHIFLYPQLVVDKPMPDFYRLINPESGIITFNTQQVVGPTLKDYLKGEPHHWLDEFIQNKAKVWRSQKVTIKQVRQAYSNAINSVVRKRTAEMLSWYRKYKHSFFQGEKWLSQMDKLVGIASKWEYVMLQEDQPSLVVFLWNFFFKEQMFHELSDDQRLLQLIRHRLLTDEYYTNSFANWHITSFSQCNTTEWIFDYQPRMKYREHNSSCVFNLMRGLNLTYLFMRERNVHSIKEMKAGVTMKLRDKLEGVAQSLTQEQQYINRIFQNRFALNLEVAFNADQIFLEVAGKSLSLWDQL